MPKRTNTFQTVIYLIKKHIAGESTVTESAELIDLVSGEKREVDVCIETEVSGHRVIISIECVDRHRRQAIGWVEQMHAKHSRLPTNLLVLVSSSGFTRGALAKAKSYGIETVVPEDITDARAGEIADQESNLRYTKLDLLEITTVSATFGATDTEAEEDFVLLPTAGDINVYTKDHEFVDMLKDLVNRIIRTTDYGEVLRNAPDDTKSFEIWGDPPAINLGDPPNLRQLYVERTEPQLHLRHVKRLSIQGSARITRSDIPLQYGQLQNTTYRWGESTFEGQPVVAVVTDNSQGEVMVSVRIL